MPLTNEEAAAVLGYLLRDKQRSLVALSTAKEAHYRAEAPYVADMVEALEIARAALLAAPSKETAPAQEKDPPTE
jgi:hypothetical protein